MNKNTVAQVVSRRLNLPKSQVLDTIDTFLELIAEELVKGHSVRLAKFGKFERRTRKARLARDIKTGTSIDIPAILSPSFNPSITLKTAIRG